MAAATSGSQRERPSMRTSKRPQMRSPARPPARRRQHPVGERRGQRRRRVAAAAVDDDHLGAAPPQRRQRLERGDDARRLVQRWNDDGQFGPRVVHLPTHPRLQAWNRSTQASSRSGAWAFFQTPATYLLASASVG